MKNSLLTIFFVLLAGCSAALAQPSARLTNSADAGPLPCETRSAIVDVIHQQTPANESIIVIARLGDRDTRPNLNWRRLHNVRAYWTEFLPEGYRRRPETIILAEGERVAGYGRLEFYLNGRLTDMIRVARNSDVDFGNCADPPDNAYGIHDPCRMESRRIFYPCRDRYMRRRNRR